MAPPAPKRRGRPRTEKLDACRASATWRWATDRRIKTRQLSKAELRKDDDKCRQLIKAPSLLTAFPGLSNMQPGLPEEEIYAHLAAHFSTIKTP
jgi:hypothetical protein